MPTVNMEPAKSLPYLPNELRIRILTFIEDPHFLWTICRRVSPEFKQWAEEQYARNHLPRMRFEMQITCGNEEERLRQDIPFRSTERLDFVFQLGAPWEKPWSDDLRPHQNAASKIFLKHRHPAFRLLKRDPARVQTPPNYPEDETAPLKELRTREIWCQIQSEVDLGIRPPNQHHVCPCRSLKDNTRRGFCWRYIGVENLLEWDPESKLLGMWWVQLLDLVHAGTCHSA
jgi:hypothetical protein